MSVRDTTPPRFDRLPDAVAGACHEVPPPETLVATDACAGEVPVAFVEQPLPGACEDSYRLGRRWTAEDRCGNVAAHSQVVAISDDLAPAVDALLELFGGFERQSLQVVCSAEDNCDPAPTLEAALAVVQHDVDADGQCVERRERVRVNCGQLVEIRLLAPAWSARPPAARGQRPA